MEDIKPLLEKKAICTYLGICDTTFLKYIQEDPTFPVRMIGGKWKARLENLQEWYEKQPAPGDSYDPNVILLSSRKRGRPPLKKSTSPGGWKINIPNDV